MTSLVILSTDIWFYSYILNSVYNQLDSISITMYLYEKNPSYCNDVSVIAGAVVSVDPLFSDANASIGSDELCNSNPNHFACDGKVGNHDEEEYDKEKEQGNDDWTDSCRTSGYRAGQNGPFSQETHSHCGDESGGASAYVDGFIDGCVDAGNTKDVCENATD